MKIIMIRHDKVNMTWQKRYSTETYDQDAKVYDERSIVCEKQEKLKIGDTECIYISELNRTYETACELFDQRDFIKTPLINEVPLRSFCDTSRVYPLWLWDLIGRMQWLFQSKRQEETKAATQSRAKKMIELLEKNNQDCYLVTHGFYLRILIKELKKKGYKIQRHGHFGIANLEQIIAVK